MKELMKEKLIFYTLDDVSPPPGIERSRDATFPGFSRQRARREGHVTRADLIDASGNAPFRHTNILPP